MNSSPPQENEWARFQDATSLEPLCFTDSRHSEIHRKDNNRLRWNAIWGNSLSVFSFIFSQIGSNQSSDVRLRSDGLAEKFNSGRLEVVNQTHPSAPPPFCTNIPNSSSLLSFLSYIHMLLICCLQCLFLYSSCYL